MKNIYDGKAVADAAGEFTVQMPEYFEALNTDFRYQLTPLGRPGPNLHIKEELNGGRFVVGGAAPGQTICWQITGNRKDPAAVAFGFEVEKEKDAKAKGRYRAPEAYGKPPSDGVGWSERVRAQRTPRFSKRTLVAE